MPKIAREGEFEIWIHTRKEHAPAHAHVYFQGTVVRVGLYDLRIIDKVKRHKQKPLIEAVKKHRHEALQVWKRLIDKGAKP